MHLVVVATSNRYRKLFFKFTDFLHLWWIGLDWIERLVFCQSGVDWRFTIYRLPQSHVNDPNLSKPILKIVEGAVRVAFWRDRD